MLDAVLNAVLAFTGCTHSSNPKVNVTSPTAVARSMLFCGCAALAAMASDCDDPPPLYDVASIEILPNNVQVLAGESVQLQARLRDSYGRLLRPSLEYDVEWFSDDASVLSVTSPGYTTNVSTVDVGTGVSATVRVRARALDRETIATVTVLSGATAATADWILSKHTAGEPPSVGLADGQRTSMVLDETFFFAGAARLDNLTSPPLGEVSIFSTTLEAGDSISLDWKATSATTDFRARLQTPRPVAVHIWNASLDSDEDVALRIDRTNQIFRDNFTGMTFRSSARDALTVAHLNVINICSTIGSSAQLGNEFDPAPTDKAIHLVLVQSLAFYNPPYPPDQETGVTCPAGTVTTAPVLIVNVGYSSDDVLAHELGHALALTRPCIGHTNEMKPFDTTNVMWAQVGGRSHFSVGQVFRMALDGSSWLNVGGYRTGSTRLCTAGAEAQQPCPRLFHPRALVEYQSPGWCS